MKRIVVIVATACLFAVTANADPGIWGARGLFRVQDARTEGDWQLSLSLHGLHRSTSFANIPEQWRMGYRTDMTVYTEDFVGAIDVSPAKYVKVFYWFGGLREYSSRHPDSSIRQMAWLKGYDVFGDWHNSVPGVKLSLPLPRGMTLGALVGYGTGYDPSGWRWGRFGIPPIDGLVLSGLGTFVLSDAKPGLPTVHVNVGRLGSGTVSLAAAAERETGKFDVFAEFVSELNSDDSSPWAGDKVYLSPGVRFHQLPPVTFDLGASIGLNKATPAFEIDAGVSMTTTFYKPPKLTMGAITGRVVDASSGAPLAASVAFPDEPELSAVKTDAREGAFRLAKVKAGPVTVVVSARGFKSKSLPVEVKAGKTAQLEFRLEESVTAGTISGTVTDASSGKPLKATIELAAGKPGPVETGSDGSFGFPNMAPGEHVLSASCPGYLKATTTVTVAAGQTARPKIGLVKKGMEITMKVFFDVDKWDLKPESHKALEDAARIMTENPEIKVEIQGHTDSTESQAYNQKLSERRAKAVVDYLVQTLKIDPARLEPKGFGKMRPAAPNGTEEGRALNRRVEFVILK